MSERYFMSKNEMSISVYSRNGTKYIFYRHGGQMRPTSILESEDQKDIAESEFVVETDKNGKLLKIEIPKHEKVKPLSYVDFVKNRKERKDTDKIILEMLERKKEQKMFESQSESNIEKPKNIPKQVEAIEEEEEFVNNKIILTADEYETEKVFGIFQLKKDGSPQKNPVAKYPEAEKAQKHCNKLNKNNEGKQYSVVPM